MADSTNIGAIPDFAKTAVKSPKRPKSAKAPRPPKAAKAAKPLKQERSATVVAGQAVVWMACLAIGAASLAPMERFAEQEVATLTLMQANTTAIADALGRTWPETAAPAYLEALSELALDQPTPDVDSSYAAARRATKADPARAFAWANIAYLEYRKAKSVNAATLDALTKSMEACPLCSEDLIRWRFNFVLANWNAIPEAMRRRAFDQADLLRWVGANTEFLAEMRAKAMQASIPYDAYRNAVNTPVRSWDLRPPTQALLTSSNQPQRPNV